MKNRPNPKFSSRWKCRRPWTSQIIRLWSQGLWEIRQKGKKNGFKFFQNFFSNFSSIFLDYRYSGYWQFGQFEFCRVFDAHGEDGGCWGGQNCLWQLWYRWDNFCRFWPFLPIRAFLPSSVASAVMSHLVIIFVLPTIEIFAVFVFFNQFCRFESVCQLRLFFLWWVILPNILILPTIENFPLFGYFDNFCPFWAICHSGPVCRFR